MTGVGAMNRDEEQQQAFARKGRMVALVMAGAVLLWLAAQWLGGYFGLPPRYVFLFDFAALAALFWALVVTNQIWRDSRKK
ncbi:DUF5337 domain-containing protein [Actibacterium sp. XHP0104]|uniref:DUF5337 domain-containing protein n=1 Tax=Actibacterium sp. XHP0104 TaxID=2984335 RepID=UPI0021E93148|nr:DUF5337 domain-containing protein [Actibacterium sp. XHP0104]MCV2880688.1 DUF5337 domain-containing protein [Actibacterium sp. XHP0104]